MSTTFNLTNSATEVNTALQAVVGADTTPTNGSSNMVTSDGVFDFVGTQIGALAGKTVTTESTGIAATDNDTSLPTSAAVKDFVDTSIAADTSTPNNRLRIKILPTHFTGANRSQNGAQVSVPSDGIYASTDIPAGYKATHFTHITSSSSVSITVSEAQVGDSTLATKGSGSGSGTKTIDMTDVVGTDENYLVVTLAASGTRYYYGGYFTIAAV